VAVRQAPVMVARRGRGAAVQPALERAGWSALAAVDQAADRLALGSADWSALAWVVRADSHRAARAG
jgi:hypothetical protein